MIFLSVLSFVASILYFFVGYRAFRSNRKSELCRVFFYSTLSMTIWSFGWGFIYLAETEVQYSFWNKVSAIGWCSFEALVLYFMMIFTGNKLIRHWYMKVLILLPAPIFLYMVLFLFGPNIETSPVVETLFYTGNFLYNFLYLAISMILLFLWGKKSKSKIQKKQASIITICSLISYMLTLVLQTILPAFGALKLPNMGQIFTLIMLLGVNYAIIKYQFMSIPTSLITNELFNELTGLTFLIDSQGFIIKANRQVYTILDYTESDIVGKHINNIIKHEQIGKLMECSESIHKLMRFQDIDVTTKTGIQIPFNFSINPLISKSNFLLGFLIIGEDIRVTKWLQDEIVKHKLTNEKLQNSEELFRTILEITPISIILTSKSTGRIKYLNTRAADLFNAEASELIGSNITEYLMKQEDKKLLIDSINNSKEVSQKEVVLKTRDGSQLLGLLTMIPSIYHEEEVALSCIIDMTDQKRVEETLKQNNESIKKLNKELVLMNNILVNKSIKDGLTNLFNYQYMKEILETNLREATKSNENLCVMMLDIDCFKRVNDRYGHQMGDKVLVTVADLIMKNTRGSDYIGRYGGEEFLVVLPNTSMEDATLIAERIRTSIQDFKFGLEDLKITISIGVAQYINEMPHALVNRADMLLYQAKNNGKNRVEYNLNRILD